VFEAVRKETQLAAQTKQHQMASLKKAIQTGTRRLPLDTRLSIGMATRAFLRTVNAIKRVGNAHYVEYVQDLLEMVAGVFEDLGVSHLSLNNRCGSIQAQSRQFRTETLAFQHLLSFACWH
jgi:hypothetical protein